MKQRFLILAAIALFSIATLSSTSRADDSFDFRFSPLGLLIGGIDVSLDVAVSPQWTLGPELSYTHLAVGGSSSDFSLKGYSAGVRGNWFHNGVFKSGLYLAPAIHIRDIAVAYTATDGTTSTGKLTGPSASFIVGYGWFWDSFNILLGGGLESQIGKSSITVVDNKGTSHTDSAAGTSLIGEFSLGWTF